jgi:ABC-2 type transport system permease protein
VRRSPIDGESPMRGRLGGRLGDRLGVVALVARREVTEGLASRAVRISWVVTTAIILALTLVPRLAGGAPGPPRHEVGAVAPPPHLEAALERSAARSGLSVRLRTVADLEAAEDLVAGEDLDVALVGDTLLARADASTALVAAVETARTEAVIAARLAELGLPSGTLAGVLAPPPPLSARTVGDPGPDAGALGAATITVIGLFLALTIYGGAVLNGVLSEKTSRVVEVLLASIGPGQLLAGKLVGIGGLGLAQVGAQASIALVSLSVGGGVDLPPGTVPAIASTVVWFVLGYLLYASFYAVAGSLVSRQEDAQAAAMPVAVVLTTAYVVTLAVVLPSPDSVAARVLGFVPVTAPTTAIARTALGSAALWELALGAVVTLASVVVALAVAARAYSGAILRHGGRVRLGTALRR